MNLSADTPILMTGSTGFIGSEIAIRLARLGLGRITHLVRAAGGTPPAVRIADACGFGAALHADFEAVSGDLERPMLGLSGSDRGRLAEARIIIHAAADTSLVRGRRCHAANSEGMARLLDLASGLRTPPLVFLVGTAYTGAIPNRCVSETTVDPVTGSPGYASAYTLSKAAAERLLITSGLPYMIVRPSIVIGMTAAGCLASPLRIFDASRHISAVPLRPEAVCDVVPLGFVAEGIIRLLRCGEPRHRIYHLTGGPERCISGHELTEVEQHINGRRRPVRLLGECPSEATERLMRSRGVPSRAAAELAGFLPFLNLGTSFDNSRVLAEFPELRMFLVSARECLLEAGFVWAQRRPALPFPAQSAAGGRGTRPATALRASPQAE